MHLAGALNIKTISFFGESLFSGPLRWATVSKSTNQYNFIAVNVNLLEVEKLLLSI